MKFHYSYTFKTYILITFFCILSLVSSSVKPEIIWFAGFLSWTIPFAILIQLFFLCYYLLYKKSIKAVLPLVLILFSYSFISRTISYNSQNSDKADLKILSFNVKVFNAYASFNENNYASAQKMIDWINKSNADIICLQEFYNEDLSSELNTLKKISQKTKMKYFFSSTHTNNVGAEFGMVIFSKLPIEGKGIINQDKKSNNQMMYLDLKTKDTTIRIYNVHLKSMSINDSEVMKIDSLSKQKYKNLYGILKQGFIDRSIQLSLLEDHINLCPYPIILCGDLNDLPYGNTYTRLSKLLLNSFEEKGNGFGFSYNGKIPFLRIDNVFYSSFFNINSFQTIDSMKLSDHFPVFSSFNYSKN